MSYYRQLISFEEQLANTFIGGVGATINTAQLLATKLAINVSRITLFSVVGNDIQCKIDGIYEIPAFCFREQGNGITYYDDKSGLVSILNSECFSGSFGTNTLQSVNFPNATSINQSFNYTTLLKKIEFLNCTSVLGAVFDFSNIEIAYFPKCNILGNTSGNNNVFSNVTKLKIIYVNPFLQTNNNGQPDGDLSFAISQGIIVRYVTNFTVPNTITTLSASTIYNSSVKLNFTPPSSTNAIDYYEVYVNGIFKHKITSPEDYVSGLMPNTNYAITIVVVDVFYNKSAPSNPINITTTNSSFDADAQLFINATAISDIQHRNYIHDLVLQYKENYIWSLTDVIYPMIGGTALTHKYNLKNPLDTNAGNRLVFNGGVTHSDKGILPNGSSGWADTFYFKPVDNLIRFSFYSRTFNEDTGYDISAVKDGSNGYNVLSLKTSNNAIIISNSVINSETSHSGNNNSSGYLMGQFDGTIIKVFKNGINKIVTTSFFSSQNPIKPFVLFAYRDDANNFVQFSRKQCAFVTFGKPITNIQALEEYKIIQAFQRALGREVDI